MASGKTVELIQFSRAKRWRAVLPRETVKRDRTLTGKKRIKARKRENKIQKSDD